MKKINEAERLEQMTQYERPFWERGIAVAGMDEVGRGPLAGPVVAACVILPPGFVTEGVNDSKKLTKKRMEKLYPLITGGATAFGTGWVFQKEIDEINILQATKKAFAEAYRNALAHCPGDYVCSDVFVDAVKDLDIPAVQHSLIHGDALCYSIAAASIVAKVERDRYMIAAAEKFPQYGFEKNVGYGTKQHMEALREFGPCELHRRSFIKRILAERGEC